MAQTCTKCNRANPSDAVYCYYDGMVLNGQGRAGGPVAVGAQTFNNPFVFPSGKTCRTFNELALACQDEWSAAKDLLRQGFLETFFGGLGRMDLAMAAKQSAQFPDHDRGLDDILGKLPVDVLQPARLSLETKDINLGVLAVGTEGRKIELAMENTGGRLVYGTASCPDGWLTFGDQPGINQKNLEFTHDYTLPVKVVGDRLRASNKPVETKILLETSGGTKVVAVRAEVPVKPFPPCVLGGAKSPRQVAEKAKANPKDAAPLFERGEVRNWYKSNGWTYPVQGPDASGIGAVQQFFEALGLTPPPKVDVSQRSIALAGNAGDQLRHMIEVKTEEKRPVYAHAVSDEPWLEVGRAKLTGRTATISLAVPTVPNRPGQKLTAKLTVQSNGNQRFVIPVTLQVGGAMSFAPPEPPPPVMAPPETDFSDISSPAVESPVAPSRRSRQQPTNPAGAFMNLVPAILLLLAVLGVVLFDLVRDKSQAQAGQGPPPPPEKPNEKPPSAPEVTERVQSSEPGPGKLGVSADPMNWKLNISEDNPDPLLDLSFFDDNQRFGLVMRGVPDPRPEYKGRFKMLTSEPNGVNNNTIIKVGNWQYYFGKELNQNYVWTTDEKGKKRKGVPLPPPRYGTISQMRYVRDQIVVTQHVEIIPNSAGIRDTCLIHYTIKNENTFPQTVGMRFLLDTFIGANDGVPFLIPGRRGFLTTQGTFLQKVEMPDYIEAVENPNDAKDQGTIVRLTLKGLRFRASATRSRLRK